MSLAHVNDILPTYDVIVSGRVTERCRSFFVALFCAAASRRASVQPPRPCRLRRMRLTLETQSPDHVQVGPSHQARSSLLELKLKIAGLPVMRYLAAGGATPSGWLQLSCMLNCNSTHPFLPHPPFSRRSAPGRIGELNPRASSGGGGSGRHSGPRVLLCTHPRAAVWFLGDGRPAATVTAWGNVEG